MDEQEPGEQFEATDYDEDGNIKLPPPVLTPPKPKRPTVAGLKKELDDLTVTVVKDVLEWLGQLDARLDNLEGKAVENLPSFVPDINARIDNQDAAIDVLAIALRSHLADVTVMKSKPEPELEFAQPPARTYDERTRTGDITGMANVCQHMTDVLLICRYLKEDPDMSDEDRNGILDIACRSSGVILAPGLQIRAGVRNVEA